MHKNQKNCIIVLETKKGFGYSWAILRGKEKDANDSQCFMFHLNDVFFHDDALAGIVLYFQIKSILFTRSEECP